MHVRKAYTLFSGYVFYDHVYGEMIWKCVQRSYVHVHVAKTNNDTSLITYAYRACAQSTESVVGGLETSNWFVYSS